MNLGSLIEGLLKLHLSVWYNDYKKYIDAIKDKKGLVIDPYVLMLKKLKKIFKLKIFPLWEEGFGNPKIKLIGLHGLIKFNKGEMLFMR